MNGLTQKQISYARSLGGKYGFSVSKATKIFEALISFDKGNMTARDFFIETGEVVGDMPTRLEMKAAWEVANPGSRVIPSDTSLLAAWEKAQKEASATPAPVTAAPAHKVRPLARGWATVDGFDETVISLDDGRGWTVDSISPAYGTPVDESDVTIDYVWVEGEGWVTAPSTPKIVNLTPHEINIHAEDVVTSVPPASTPARCVSTSEQVDTIAGIPVFVTTFGEVTGLPEPTADTIFIVSRIVADAVARTNARPDVFVPGEGIRDDAGRIVGCKGIARI